MSDTNERQRMKDVSHTNPYTGETTGRLFRRGPVVAADGGKRDAADSADERGTMKDVNHTPPHDADDANEVFERGGREHGVEDEE